MEFAKQTAIVTGAGQGIGFEIARQLSLQGANVVLNDVEEGLAVKAADLIKAEGGVCHPVAGDSGDPLLVEHLVIEAVKLYGSLDLAVANAGITLFGDFLEYSADSLNKVLRVNLAGSFLLAQFSAKQMIRQNKGGSILFMSSVTGRQAHKDLAAYSMTKAGLEMLARNLVIELAPFGITVNAVAPGATLTERTTEDPEYIPTWTRLTPTGRPGTVEDVANAVLFLLSPKSRQITGHTIVVDGGWSAISPSPYEK